MVPEKSEAYQKAWHSSIRLLAMREHSDVELLRKLQKHALTQDESQQLLQTLQDEGYLSNTRFATSLVRSLVLRGRGPLKIGYELRSKGIDDDEAQQAMRLVEDELMLDWVTLAAEQRRRKFGDQLPTDYKERARQSRFLAGRGFYLDSINAIFHEKC